MKNVQDGPDRGWSWVVAFAACFNSLVLAGIFRTSGVLFVAFISEFGVTREEASWPVVLCISVLNLTGPFSGLLSQKYGIRPITMVGALVATIGVSSCYFTTSLEVITILFGVIFGIGYGLISTLMPVIVNMYFLNLRATANGIANSGSCFGSIILPVFFEFLIGHYGLSGCFLLTGGIVLNIAVACALLRHPSWLQSSHKQRLGAICKNVPSTNYEQNVDQIPSCAVSKVERNKRYDAVIKSMELSHSVLEKSSHTSTSSRQPLIPDKLRTSISKQGPENIQPSFVIPTKQTVGNDYKTCDRDYSLDQCMQEISENRIASEVSNSNDSETTGTNLANSLEIELKKSIDDFEKSLNDFTFVSGNSGENIANENGIDCKSRIQTNTTDTSDSCPRHHKSSNDVAKRNSESVDITSETNFHKCSSGDVIQCAGIDNFPKFGSPDAINDTQNYVKTVPNNIVSEQEESMQLLCKPEPEVFKPSPGLVQSFFTVLFSPMFYVTAITNVSFYFLFHMYVVIVVDYSLDQGVPDSDTKFIIFAFSISDLFGRLCLGWITDRRFMKRSYFVMTCMALIGVVFFFFPFATTYESLLVVSCLYGVLLGCTMVVFPIILVDILGMDLHAVAYGCMCFMNGFASFVRPFLIGYFRDQIGSYANIFYLLGGISFSASLLWLLENCFARKKALKEDLNP